MAEKMIGESAVSRVTKLPVVESTLNVASNVYTKVKDSNSVVTSVLNKAENAVFTAKEAVQPITQKFEGPIKKVDSLVCSGLDYVENKIPQIKLPTQELYENAKNSVYNTVEPAVKCVCQCAQTVAGLTGLGKICEAGEHCIFSKNKKVKAIEAKSTSTKDETEEDPLKDD